MKLREDAEFISGLVESKFINLIEAKELAALPLIMVPNETLPGNEEFRKFWDEEIKTNRRVIKLTDWEDIPFYDFIVIYNYNPKWKLLRSLNNKGIFRSDFENMIFIRVAVDKENDTVRKSYSANGYDWIDVTQLGEENIPSFDEMTLKFSNGYKVEGEQRNEYLHDITTQCFGATLTALIMWHRYHCRSDRYVISVKTNKALKTKNLRTNEIVKVLGPRIIYLDKMPSEDDEVVSESGNGNKAPHQRKGCWITLRAERYKNHPMFQVKNGIYRKPARIGDRTRIVHGATYTVIDKQVNFDE